MGRARAAAPAKAAPRGGGGGKGGASSAPAPSEAASSYPPVWVTWVEGVTYTPENVWDKRIPREVLALYRPPTRLPPPSAAEARSGNVRAGRITDPLHPAFGQCGLFAARRLRAGEHVCDYRGVVTLRAHECKDSDYTLAFLDAADVALTLDAAAAGNEGRFINDFRGVTLPCSSAQRGGAAASPPHGGGNAPPPPGRVPARANVRFEARRDARGALQMGVFVLPGGGGVAKHAELLLSYGKGYWLARGLLRGGGDDAAVAEEAEAAEAAEEAEAAAALGAVALGDAAHRT